MSVTIGDPDGEDSEEEHIENLHERFKNMAFDEDSFTPTIFVEDKDVILPSTSSNTIEKLDRHEDLCTSAALAAVFGDGCRLFQPITQGTFVEEVIVEKPPKIVNVTFIPNV
jgi:hypothetical protein